MRCLTSNMVPTVCVSSAAQQTFLFYSAPSGLVVVTCVILGEKVTVTANATPFVLKKFTETDLYKEVDTNTCLRECTCAAATIGSRLLATIRH